VWVGSAPSPTVWLSPPPSFLHSDLNFCCNLEAIWYSDCEVSKRKVVPISVLVLSTDCQPSSKELTAKKKPVLGTGVFLFVNL